MAALAGDPRHIRPALPTSSSQGSDNTNSTSGGRSRRPPGNDVAEVPRARQGRRPRSEAGSSSAESSSATATAGGSFSEVTPGDSEERGRRHNHLGYQRAPVACTNCRRRKIRCELLEEGPPPRCVKCKHFNSECIFVPADQSAGPSRPPRPRRDGENNSESPAPLVSSDLNDTNHFERPLHNPGMHITSPQDYGSFGDNNGPTQWLQPHYASGPVVYQSSYNTTVHPYHTGGALSGMEPEPSYSMAPEHMRGPESGPNYSMAQEQVRRYSLAHQQQFQPGPMMMIERGTQASPGPAYITTASDSIWNGASHLPPMYNGYMDPSHQYLSGSSLQQPRFLNTQPQPGSMEYIASLSEVPDPNLMWHSPPGASNRDPRNSNVAPSSSDIGPSTSNIGPSNSDIGPSTSNIDPSSSDIGPSHSNSGPSMRPSRHYRQ